MAKENKPKNQIDMPLSAIDKPLTAEEIPETSSLRGIRYLTCQGGGMKGIGYVRVIEELDNCGVLAQIEEVAGSSAGAILAALIAIGCTPEEIKEEMLALDFRKFRDKREPGWIETARLKDLAPMVELPSSLSGRVEILRNIPGVVRAGRAVKKVVKLPHNLKIGLGKVSELSAWVLGSDLGLWEGDTLSSWLNNIIARKTGKPNLTFKELATLTEAKGYRFKKLILTGSNLTDGKLEYYNALETPDMPIAKAVRISASFPGGFKPVVEIDKNGEPKVKVDGGLLENLPDVFNKPPYLKPGEINEHGGNKRAFALTLFKPKDFVPRRYKNGIDLVKGLYSTKMSDQALYDKYEDNIAKIDATGIRTLGFDADDEAKEKILSSGSTAIRAAFRKILQKEANEPTPYEELPLTELVRKEIALLHLVKANPSNKAYGRELIKIGRIIENRKVSDEIVEQIKQSEEDKFLKRKMLQDPSVYTDEQMSQLCVEKRKELLRIGQELKSKYQSLSLAKAALKWQREAVSGYFIENNGNNTFTGELEEFSHIEKAIFDNRTERAFLLPGSKRKLLDQNYQELKKHREQQFNAIIEKYQREDNPVLTAFFSNMALDFDDPDFSVPLSKDELRDYYSKDIRECLEHIQLCKKKFEETKLEHALFTMHQEAFLQRESRSERFALLMNLKGALDAAIYKKLSPLRKLNNYLLDHAPRFGKVVRPFLQFTAVVGFAVIFPVWFVLGGEVKIVMDLMARSTSEKSVKQICKEYFLPANMYADNKLQKARKTVVDFIVALSNDYATTEKTKESYLNGFFELLLRDLKKQGIALSEIFPKNKDESKEAYKHRLQQLKASAHVGQTNKPPLIPELGSAAEMVPAGWRSPMEAFRKKVLRNVVKVTDEEMQVVKQMREDPNTAQSKAYLKKKQALSYRLIHLEFIQAMDKKIEHDQVLKQGEIKEYIKSKTELGEGYSPAFKEKYADKIARYAHDSQDRIEEELAASELSLESPIELSKYEIEQKLKDETTQKALDIFMQERKRERDRAKLGLQNDNMTAQNLKKRPRPKPDPTDKQGGRGK